MKTATLERSRRISRVLIGLVSLALPLVLGTSASAAYPPGPIDLGPIVYPDSPTVAAGTTFGVSVIGCEKGQQVTITFNSVVREVTCGNPRATTTFTAPCKAGTYQISAVVGGVRTFSSVTVVGTCSGIPATGASNLMSYIALSLGASLSGVMLFIVSRLRRRPSSIA